MRRLGRFIFNGLTVLSLLICLATVVMWVRSYWVNDRVDNTGADYSASGVTSRVGGVVFWHREIHGLAGGPDHWSCYSGPITPIDRIPFGQVRWSHLGFYSSYVTVVLATGIPPIHDEYVCIPYWLLLIVCGIPCVMTLRRWHRRRRVEREARLGLCPKCHYDLRATPDRCPECGTVPTKGAL